MLFALLKFKNPEAKRHYREILRARLYGAGYLPSEVVKELKGLDDPSSPYIAGRSEAERAADVANECAGVRCRLVED